MFALVPLFRWDRGSFCVLRGQSFSGLRSLLWTRQRPTSTKIRTFLFRSVKIQYIPFAAAVSPRFGMGQNRTLDTSHFYIFPRSTCFRVALSDTTLSVKCVDNLGINSYTKNSLYFRTEWYILSRNLQRCSSNSVEGDARPPSSPPISLTAVIDAARKGLCMGAHDWAKRN